MDTVDIQYNKNTIRLFLEYTNLLVYQYSKFLVTYACFGTYSANYVRYTR